MFAEHFAFLFQDDRARCPCIPTWQSLLAVFSKIAEPIGCELQDGETYWL
jgi:hypothetical protein